jgi:hypothetical protein
MGKKRAKLLRGFYPMAGLRTMARTVMKTGRKTLQALV